MVKISTSILSYEDIEIILKLNKTDTDYIHIDVMDGKFVEPTAFSLEEIKMINHISNKPLDVHLMVEDIDAHLNALSLLNIDIITFHYEMMTDVSIIDKIHALKMKCGISVKPDTDVKEVFPYLEKVDLVLLMSVEPGYSGQKFMDYTFSKIEMLKREIINRKLQVLISVDGGINSDNARMCVEKGVDIIVAATYIIKSDDFQERITALRSDKESW